MKRFSSMFFLFLICCLLLVPYNVDTVKAADDSATKNSYVYYQGISIKGSSAKSVSVVAQYYYTKYNSLGSANTPIAAKSSAHFPKIFDSASQSDLICKTYRVNTPLSTHCGGNDSLPSIASLVMNAAGDITLTLANEVTLQSLNVYYIIANQIGTSALFCSGKQLCDNSLYVLGANGNGQSNWRKNAKDGSNMRFDSYNIGEKFSVSENASGKKVYSGYNIFKNMSNSIAKQAEAAGAYVLTSLSVSYKGTVYHVGTHTVSSRRFEKSNDGNSASYLIRPVFSDDPTDSSKEVTAANGETTLADYSPLVKPVKLNTSSGETNAGFGVMGNFFEETLRPILIIAIGILFVIVGTHTGVVIVRSSDEPEVRREAIKKFIGLFIGAFTIAMILIFYKDIVGIVQDYF